MLLKRWNNLDSMRDEISRFQDEMSQWLGWVPRRDARSTASTFPAMNMWRDEDHVFVEMELPGLDQDDLEVLVTPENELVVFGERGLPLDEDGRWYRRERRFGEFRRQIALPVEVDPDQVTAELKAGMLRIRLTEKAVVKPRKIEVHRGSQS